MPPRPIATFLRGPRLAPIAPRLRRPYAASSLPLDADAAAQTPGEKKVFALLDAALAPRALQVQDVSGGCGAVYSLNIVADRFRGLSTLQQHRLVTRALGDEVKRWHGLQLKTAVPADDDASDTAPRDGDPGKASG